MYHQEVTQAVEILEGMIENIHSSLIQMFLFKVSGIT